MQSNRMRPLALAAVALAVALQPVGIAQARQSHASHTWIVSPKSISKPAKAPGKAATRRELRRLRRVHDELTPEQRQAVRRWNSRAVVDRWIATTLDQIVASKLNPVRGSRALAMVSVAMNDALQAARAREGSRRRRSAPCRVLKFDGRCRRQESLPAQAVVAGAAAETLVALFPQDKAALLAKEREAIDALTFAGWSYPSDGREAARLGRSVGRRVVHRRAHDGSSKGGTRRAPTGPAYWVPTPPAFLPPLEPFAGRWRPWNLKDVDDFRPSRPPTHGSAAFEKEMLRVYEISNPLSERHRRIALFWDDGAGTTTPPGHWNKIALSQLGRMSPRRAATLFATLNTAQSDAVIACWNAKYDFWLVRPVTVIHRFDPDWQPAIVTPPHPSYPSGHSTTSAAAATVLSHFLPRRARRLHALAREAARSRLYGGIHYAMDNAAGLKLGARMGKEAVAELRR
jgi:PAP2 superfamily protein